MVPSYLRPSHFVWLLRHSIIHGAFISLLMHGDAAQIDYQNRICWSGLPRRWWQGIQRADQSNVRCFLQKRWEIRLSTTDAQRGTSSTARALAKRPFGLKRSQTKRQLRNIASGQQVILPRRTYSSRTSYVREDVRKVGEKRTYRAAPTHQNLVWRTTETLQTAIVQHKIMDNQCSIQQQNSRKVPAGNIDDILSSNSYVLHI